MRVEAVEEGLVRRRRGGRGVGRRDTGGEAAAKAQHVQARAWLAESQEKRLGTGPALTSREGARQGGPLQAVARPAEPR